MSRYPGTQFRVHDNSQATAIVPVANTNRNDAVQYLTSFTSVKGPEGITLVNGEDFYTRYGTQDNIDFKKYGQPLFQASMNINNGATLLAKRAVLDDATLANATLGVVITKYKDAKITSNENGLITSIKFDEKTASKYSISPVVFSIDNSNNYAHAKKQVNEYKERYDLYKNYIIDVIANQDTPNNVFLNKLYGKDDTHTPILSGFAQSIYYDADDKVIDITTSEKSNVRKVSSITIGPYSSKLKTISSNFTPDDLIEYTDGDGKDITAGVAIDENNVKKYKLEKTKDGLSWKDITQEKNHPAVFYGELDGISISRIFASLDDANAIIDSLSVYMSDDYPEGVIDNEIAIVIPGIDTSGYTSAIRLANDLMVKKSHYIDCEFIFPLFTIFDNGRGDSIKSIGIEFDSASSMTLKKAIYSLSIYNYNTTKRLEKFSFSLNPYIRNDNTGYSFDIESAVNYVSKQVSVKTYHDTYDALLETLQNIMQSNDKDIITNNDILFGHNINGSYPAFTSYNASNLLNRLTYVYDYAHLDIFDNDIISVNACCDSDNMTIMEDSAVKYYFYNYVRQKSTLIEKLEKGSNGYVLTRTDKNVNVDENNNEVKYKVPFLVLDDSETTNIDSLNQIFLVIGQKNGTIISTADVETESNICLIPELEQNFLKIKLKLFKIKHYCGSTVDNENEFYTLYNSNTLSKTDVYDMDDVIPEGVCGWKFEENPNHLPSSIAEIVVYIPISVEALYQEQYRRFFNGDYDRDIFNLDVYFPNALFDANYSKETKLAIQRLAAYRGDFMCYMDMGINEVNSYTDCFERVPSTLSGVELTPTDNNYYYVRDMHIAVTCIYYKMRNPYDNKVISVTGTYGLSNRYITHFANDVSKVFAGISNGITIDNVIEGSVNYIPKIYPTDKMVSLSNIGGVYPSDDETIVNEKQMMCDLRVNYGCYYEDRFSIETEYTMNPTESEFSYWNNVALVCIMMQAIRKACPTARYQFVTNNDLSVYQTAVETAMKPWRSKFAKLTFKYVQDEAAIENKIFYAAIEVVFKPFAQAEIFELTALNYSTLSNTITNV